MATLYRKRVNAIGGTVENTSVVVGSVVGLKAADTVVTDGATTNASTTVTSATAAFTADDVGMTISGSGIPAGATIASVTNATTVVISAAATATASGVTLTIGRSTLLRSAALAAMSALGTDEYLTVTFNPDGEGGAAPEIAYITAHSAGATIAAILRGQEGTSVPTNGWPQDTFWVHSPTIKDFDGKDGGNGVIGLTTYGHASTDSDIAITSTSFVDLDATNLKVDFTVPPSGRVLVTLSGSVFYTSGGLGFWNLREGTTDIGSLMVGPSANVGGWVTAQLLVTGLTPGAAKTYKWGGRVQTAGTLHNYHGPTYGKFVMKVEAVNV